MWLVRLTQIVFGVMPNSHKGSQEEDLLTTQTQAMGVRTFLTETFELDDTKLKTKGMGKVDVTEPGKTHWLVISIYDSGVQAP